VEGRDGVPGAAEPGGSQWVRKHRKKVDPWEVEENGLQPTGNRRRMGSLGKKRVQQRGPLEKGIPQTGKDEKHMAVSVCQAQGSLGQTNQVACILSRAV